MVRIEAASWTSPAESNSSADFLGELNSSRWIFHPPSPHSHQERNLQQPTPVWTTICKVSSRKISRNVHGSPTPMLWCLANNQTIISQETSSHSNRRRISNIAAHKFTTPFPMLYRNSDAFPLHARTYGQHFLYCNNLGHRRTFSSHFNIKTQLHPTILSSPSPRP